MYRLIVPRFLDHATVSCALGAFVTDAEVAALLRRKDAILAYFDELVAKKVGRCVMRPVCPFRLYAPPTGTSTEVV